MNTKKTIESMKKTQFITGSVESVVSDNPAYSAASVAAELNSMGIRSFNGACWSERMVYNWMSRYGVQFKYKYNKVGGREGMQDVKNRASSVRKLIKAIKNGKLQDEVMRRAKWTISNLESQGIV